MDKKIQEQYLKNPRECPYCHSHDIQGDSFDMDQHEVIQRVSCVECGMQWDDIYRLHRAQHTGPTPAPVTAYRKKYEGYTVYAWECPYCEQHNISASRDPENGATVVQIVSMCDECGQNVSFEP